MGQLTRVFTLTNSLMLLGFLAMLLSGEIFFKVMMALTSGSILISLCMAVIVEGGKFFLTLNVAKTKNMSRLNWFLYGGIKSIMVSFSLLASLFFFSQFLSDNANVNKVVEQARFETTQEFDRRALILRENLQDIRNKDELMDQRVGQSSYKQKGHWQLLMDRKQVKLSVEKERKQLTNELILLEQERSKKMIEVSNPSIYSRDERSRNQSLNTVVSTLKTSGLPVNYNGLLLSFCALISIFLEVMIHITAAFPTPLAKKPPVVRKPSLLQTKKPNQKQSLKGVVNV